MSSIKTSQTSMVGLGPIILVCFALFFFDDVLRLALPAAMDGAAVYYVDYFKRVAMLAIVMGGTVSRQSVVAGWHQQSSHRKAFGMTIAFTLCFLIIDFFAQHGLPNLPIFVFAIWPDIRGTLLHTVDLTFGLILVAIVEEILSRKLIRKWMEQRGFSPFLVILLSSLFFSVAHVFHGTTTLLTSFIFGVMMMVLYQRTNRIAYCMVAHYFVNLVIFW